MADDKHSDAKLLEISREAHKLTQMIRSWPKAPNFDCQSKGTTKDLMIGAFGLQEYSQITLGKKTHKKEKLDLDFTRGSGRFERFAMDGSLFSYIDELKNVIRASSCSQGHGKVSSSQSLGLLMKKEKGPNLIAKLMGIEELPSGSYNPALQEHRNDGCFVQQKSILAIEMPTIRMLSSMEEKPEPGTKKTVKDVVESVKSKEVSESDKIKKHKRMPRSVPCIDNEVPTNVTERTPQFPCSIAEFDRIVAVKKTQSTNPTPKEVVCRSQPMLSRKFERKEVKNMRNIVISYQKTANLALIDEQQQKRKVLTSTRLEGSARSKQLMNGRKPEDGKELKVVAAPKSQAKPICRAPAKSDKRSSIHKDISSNDQLMICKGSTAARKHSETSTIKPMLQHFSNALRVKKKTEAKLIRKSLDIKALAGNANYKDVEVTNRSFNLPADAPAKQVQQNYKPCNREHRTIKESKICCEVMVKSSPKESTKLPKNKTNLQAQAKEDIDVQIILLNSQCFIRHAQELFGLANYQTTRHLEVRTGEAELLLDCVKEFMERKKHGMGLSYHQMPQTSLQSIAVASVNQLADEIGYRIEKLNSYSRNDIGVSLRDGIYVTLEKDIRCKDLMLNAMWDVGWVNWICVEEVDIVVGRVEGSILYGLVEELVVDFIMSCSPL